MSNLNRIQKLEKAIQDAKEEQSSCNHKWGTPFEKEFIKKEHYDTGEYHSYGVHLDSIWAYRDKKVMKWTRECKKCGKVEVTKKMKKIVIETEPDFD